MVHLDELISQSEVHLFEVREKWYGNDDPSPGCLHECRYYDERIVVCSSENKATSAREQLKAELAKKMEALGDKYDRMREAGVHGVPEHYGTNFGYRFDVVEHVVPFAELLEEDNGVYWVHDGENVEIR